MTAVNVIGEGPSSYILFWTEPLSRGGGRLDFELCGPGGALGEKGEGEEMGGERVMRRFWGVWKE